MKITVKKYNLPRHWTKIVGRKIMKKRRKQP